jgi:hypothetical protein
LIARLDKLTKALALSEPQRKKIRTLSDEANRTLSQTLSALHGARKKLHRLLHDENTKTEQIEKLVEEIGRLNTQRLKITVLTPWRLKAILKPAQLEKLDSLSWPPGSPKHPGPPKRPGSPNWSGPPQRPGSSQRPGLSQRPSPPQHSGMARH